MSIESLIGKKREPVRIGPSLILDCALREVHEIRSTVTEFPVEDGSTIADHIIPEPRELVIDGLISNSPVRILGGLFSQQVRGEVRNGKVTGQAVNLVELAFAELERIHEAKELITITGRFKTYTDMVMLSAPVMRTPEDGDSLHFTATFRKIRKVAIQRADIRAAIKTKRESAQPVKQTGKKNPTPAGKAVQTRTSAAKHLKNGAVDLARQLLGGSP